MDTPAATGDDTPSINPRLVRAGQRLFGQGSGGWGKRAYSASGSYVQGPANAQWYCRTIHFGTHEDITQSRDDIKDALTNVGVYSERREGRNPMIVWVPQEVFEEKLAPLLDYSGPGRMTAERYATRPPIAHPDGTHQALLRQEIWKRALFADRAPDWKEDPDNRVYRYTGALPYAEHPALEATAQADIEGLLAHYGCHLVPPEKGFGIAIASDEYEEKMAQRVENDVMESNVHVLRHFDREQQRSTGDRGPNGR